MCFRKVKLSIMFKKHSPVMYRRDEGTRREGGLSSFSIAVIRHCSQGDLLKRLLGASQFMTIMVKNMAAGR